MGKRNNLQVKVGSIVERIATRKGTRKRGRVWRIRPKSPTGQFYDIAWEDGSYSLIHSRFLTLVFTAA